MRPKKRKFLTFTENIQVLMSCVTILIIIKLFQLSFIIQTEKYPRLGFTIIRSECFTVVYIDDLTECHCFNFALCLTLTKSMKRKNKQKAEWKQTKSMKKKSENPVFFPNGKMLLNGLIQHIKHDQHLPVLSVFVT